MFGMGWFQTVSFRMILSGFLCVCFLGGCHGLNRGNRACFKKTCYGVELAISDEQKMKGLQNRGHLDKDKGMVFVLKGDAPEKFWMKKTLIPLDILWLDYDGKIIYIEHAAVPCEQDPCPAYGPAVAAFYVLEISGGEAATHDMRVGDRILLELKEF